MAPAIPSSAVRRYRWTRTDYERVVDVGGFGPEDRIELLDGEIWEMTPESSRHSMACSKVMQALQRAFTKGAFVSVGHPIALDDASEPEPDLAVIRGTPDDHINQHPSEALLVVEVSLSSLGYDRTRKLAAYARNGIPEYWIMDLASDTVEVYRDPTGDRYDSMTVMARGDTVAPLHATGGAVPVDDLLPKPE